MEAEQHQFTDAGSVRIYKYRWIVLFIYCLISFINFHQMLQFTIISDVIQKYYEVDSMLVDVTAIIYFILYIILFIPVSYHIENYNLKTAAIACAGTTLIGNLLKFLCISPDRIYVVFIAQTFCGIGQVYVLSLPTKLACTWFGPEEVSTASAIGILGNQLGVAIGSVLPPIFVEEDNIEDDLFNLFLYNGIFAGVVFLITIIFFKGKPKYPPSQSQLNLIQNEQTETFLPTFKRLFTNREFLILIISFGLINAIWNSFGILVNEIYLEYFPDGKTDVGIIVLTGSIAGGCIGSVAFGLLLDRTHQFKKVSIASAFASGLTFAIVIVMFQLKLRIGTLIAVPIFGFFCGSSLLIAIEYVIEITYPTPESLSCSMLVSFTYALSIAITLIMEGLFDGIGYLYTTIIVDIILFSCGIALFMGSTNLRRHEANKETLNGSVKD